MSVHTAWTRWQNYWQMTVMAPAEPPGTSLQPSSPSTQMPRYKKALRLRYSHVICGLQRLAYAAAYMLNTLLHLLGSRSGETYIFTYIYLSKTRLLVVKERNEEL
jgi:hypothetical protein